MAVAINGQTYYRTAELCRMAGINKTTLFRWLKEGIFRGLNTGIEEDGGCFLKMQ